MPHDTIYLREAETLDLIRRDAEISPNSFDAGANTVQVIWSTGAAVRRAGYTEVLSMHPDHVRLDRLVGASVLDSHQHDGLKHVIGTVTEAHISQGTGYATIRLSKRADVADIVGDITLGIIRFVSIGYSVAKWEDFIGPDGKVRTAIDWQPRELSFVAVPADPGAHVRSDPAPRVDSATRSETNAAIRSLGKTLNIATATIDGLIDRGATVEQARSAVLAEIETRAVRLPAVQLGASNDDPATIRTRMGDALAHRLGVPGELPAEAVQFRGMGLHDMMRYQLAARGERVLSMPVDELLTRAISTSDLPTLLQSTGQRTLLASFTPALSPVFQLARQTTATDFRTKTVVRLGEFEKLDLVAEHGEVTHGGVAESSESYALATYGKIFALTRQALINDDLGAFSTVSAAQGRAAAETQNDLLVKLLTQGSGLGPVMSDSNRLYNVAHGNVAASGTNLPTGLGPAVKAMRVQKGLDGVSPINAVPKYILVSPDKEAEAIQSVAGYYPPTAADVNPTGGLGLRVLIEPRLTGNRFYLFAEPGVLPVLEYAYLASAPGPQIEARQGFEVLGLQFRVVLDFGCGVTDFRGTYTNAGA